MLIRKRSLGVLFAATVLTALAARPAAAQQIAVGIKSVDGLLSDFKYVLGLAGQDRIAEQIDGEINRATAGKGLAGVGLDTKRPLGLFVNLPENLQAAQPAVILAVPVTDAEAVFKFAEQTGAKFEMQDGFRVTGSPAGPVYFKAVGGYLYGSNDKAVFAGKLPDPAGLIPSSQPNTSIAASVRIDRIPAGLKKQILDLLEQSSDDSLRGLPGGDLLQPVMQVLMRNSLEQYRDLLTDGREFALGIEINQARGVLAIEGSISAQPGTRTAARFAAYGNNRSVFTPLLRGAAAYLAAGFTLPASDAELFAKLWPILTEKAVEQQNDAKARELLTVLFKGVAAAVHGSYVDLGLTAHVAEDRKLVIAAGLGLADGKALEDAVRTVIKGLPEQREVVFKLDADSHNGTAIHEIRPGRGEEADIARVFGETVAYFAFPKNAVLFAFGRDGKTMIKRGIDGAAAPAAPLPAAMALEASVGRLASLAPEGDRIARALTGVEGGRDKVRVINKGGDANRFRFEVDAALIRAIGSLSRN
jgi:hypothetical protein